MDYSTAHSGFNEASKLLTEGTTMQNLDASLLEKYTAWVNAPKIGSLRLILDLPAFGIVAFITYIVFIGMKESRAMSNTLVIIKLAVIFLIIVLVFGSQIFATFTISHLYCRALQL